MTIDEIKQKICDQYCRFPNMQYTDVQMNDICSHCPLNDLPHWIPCSERMPGADTSVLVFTPWESVAIMDFDSQSSLWHSNSGTPFTLRDNEIIAWMPLPEPFKEDT